MSKLRIATWNQDHWKRTPAQREVAWAHVDALGVDVALLQESVPPRDRSRDRVLWKEIGGSRRWGSAVVTKELPIEEVTHARSRYARHAYSLLGTHPGSVAIARVRPPVGRPITFVSLYGVMDPYVQTTLFRVVADLIPLFDSADGDRIVLGGDLNFDTSLHRDAQDSSARRTERARYSAMLSAIESLGLVNLFRVANDRPTTSTDCVCGDGCFHVQTHRHESLVGTPRERMPAHLDYLFATPALAQRCTRLWLDEGDPEWELSDHRAVLAEIDLVEEPATSRTWDGPSFVESIEQQHGTAAAHAVTRMLDWAGASALRVHFGEGVEGEWWAQLDGPNGKLQYTFSVRTDGRVVINFRWMTAPFASQERREELRRRLSALPGVAIDPSRLGGQPTIPLAALTSPDTTESFLRVFEDVVRETRANWAIG